MSRWVSVFKWVVNNIRIPVECLRVQGVGYYDIRAYEPPNIGVIIPRAVVVKINAAVQALSGELDLGIQATGSGPRSAEGCVFYASYQIARSIGC